MCRVRPVKRIHVHSRNAARRSDFAKRMTEEAGVEVVPAEKPEDAARGLDIVITATNARDPVLLGVWIAEGQHLNVIGPNFHSKRSNR